MRLLILTQKIDSQDDLLGFFHGWVAKLAEHFDKITVIALGVGQYQLPANIKVLSLGKEKKCHSGLRAGIQDFGSRVKPGMTSEFFSKVGYGINFYRYIWRERQNYDAVFVHMNQEYVLLGWCLWRLLGKPIALWRTHPKGNWLAGLAVFFSDMVFCTSRFAYVARFKQTVLVPVGVDTEFLRPDPAVEKSPKSLLFLSRLSPIKKPDVFIEALAILKEKNVDFFARIIGDAPERDQAYALKLKDLIVKHGLGQRVEFKKGVPFSAVPAVFNAYEISVNATPSGSMDKTMFEAMACGTLVLASNKNLETILPADLAKLLVFKEADGQDLAAKAEVLLSLPADKAAEIKRRLREIVVGQQSLDRLVEKLVKRLQNND